MQMMQTIPSKLAHICDNCELTQIKFNIHVYVFVCDLMNDLCSQVSQIKSI